MGDFCYDRPMLDRVLHQAELMDLMIERVGVDAVALARLDRGTAWYEARSRCIECRHERECRDWLEGRAPSSAPPQFCANAALFRSCLSEILRDEGIVPTD